VGLLLKLRFVLYYLSRSSFEKRRMMHDVVIIGGGHNGLVCSTNLAMAGLKVVVLDQRPVVGGAAVK
jgi:ribulose 1,5-bisphosphate synthetase/thiazole synthase